MTRVTVSNKYQITIPRAVREALHIRKGQTVTISQIDGIITIVPDRPLNELEGVFPGISLEGIRDETDR